MRQHYKRCTSIIVVAEKFRERFVRQVTYAAHYTLLNYPGIGSAAQHFQIVIRFQDQRVTAADVLAHARRHVTQIGDDRYFHSLRPECEAHRIRRIVWHREWCYVHLADR